jgi:hypothetical protein
MQCLAGRRFFCKEFYGEGASRRVAKLVDDCQRPSNAVESINVKLLEEAKTQQSLHRALGLFGQTMLDL